jgi:hypothetical protein
MTERGRARDLNEAARRFAETLSDSYGLVYGQAAESAERQRERAQEFSELVASSLREQAEAGAANARQLSEQADRQREAYAEFLDSAFSRYRAGAEQATRSAQAGVRTLADTTTGLLGTATGAVGATVEGAEQAAEAAVFPMEGYDEMNVEEISSSLKGLSVEELQLVRDYEELHEGRKTLLEEMDRKIRAGSS